MCRNSQGPVGLWATGVEVVVSTTDTGEDKLGELRGLRTEGRFSSASTEDVFCHLQAQATEMWEASGGGASTCIPDRGAEVLLTHFCHTWPINHHPWRKSHLKIPALKVWYLPKSPLETQGTLNLPTSPGRQISLPGHVCSDLSTPNSPNSLDTEKVPICICL